MQRNSWDSAISLNEVLREELRFWYNNFYLFQGHQIKPPIATCAAVHTDASGTGYGGYTVSLGTHIAHGHWGRRDSQQSSTYRELKAICVRPSEQRGPDGLIILGGGGGGRSSSVSAEMADKPNPRLESSAAVGTGNDSRCWGLQSVVLCVLPALLCSSFPVTFILVGTVVDSGPLLGPI